MKPETLVEAVGIVGGEHDPQVAQIEMSEQDKRQ